MPSTECFNRFGDSETISQFDWHASIVTKRRSATAEDAAT
jgi:hypothetical protein